MNEKEALINELALQQALISLKSCNGWDVLVQHINNVKEIVMSRLLVETDHLKMIVLQERYRAFNSVIETISSAEQIALHITDQLVTINDEENLKKIMDL